MRLILAGCEYSGTTTLAFAIDDWLEDTMGARFSLIHDHWKIPDTSGHPQADMTDDERAQVLALSPELKEMTQRHSLYYHIQANSWNGPDWMAIGLHIDDSVYGPMYFGYGGDGEPHDRSVVSRQVEGSILRFAPDVTLVHVTASAEVIAERMQANPHPNGPLKDADIQTALDKFAEACERSTIPNKITLDTSGGRPYMSKREFARKIEPLMTDTDRLRTLVRRSGRL